jgi:hypothetical protein
VLRGGAGLYYGSNYYGEMTQGIQWSSNLYERYDFTSADAAPLWDALHDPTSPVYNNGELRLSNAYLNVLHAQGVRPTKIMHETDLKTPQSTQASLGIQRQLSRVLAAEASVLWSRGANNIRAMHVNPQAGILFPQGSLLPSGVVTPFEVVYRGGARPDPAFTNLIAYEMNVRTRYKGISTALNARWTSLQLRASYSWNDAWDDSTAVTSRNTPSETDCPDCEFSRSVLSTRHNFRGSAVYMTPDRWGALGRDWQLATILDFESGHPFQVTAGFDFNNDTVSTDRPIGVPRNSLWTDGYNNVDMRVSRTIPLGGRYKLEAIFEMFNLFNIAHYSNYIDTLYTSVRGTNTYAPRPDFARFAASPQLNQRDTSRTPDDIGLDAATRRSGVADPFQGQLAFRLRF